MHARIACVLLLSKVKKTMKEGAEREREMVDCEILVQGVMVNWQLLAFEMEIWIGLIGGPRLQNHGSTTYLGRAWVAISDDFGKTQHDSLTARQKIAHSCRAWADIFRPDNWVGPGLGCHFLFHAFSWSGPTRHGPRRCPGILAAVLACMVHCCSISAAMQLAFSVNWRGDVPNLFNVNYKCVLKLELHIKPKSIKGKKCRRKSEDCEA
jgi:hypothetical protein